MRKLSFALMFAFLSPAIRAGDSITYAPLRVGDVYRVMSKSSLKGTVETVDAPGKPPRTLDLDGVASVLYRERAIAPPTGPIQKTLRAYETVVYRRVVAGQVQEAGLRDLAKPIVVDRSSDDEMIFSPAGPLTFAELDLLRTHVFVPGLEGLLSPAAIEAGARWRADVRAARELLGLRKVESGELDCEFTGFVDHKSGRLAQIGVTGKVVGLSEEGKSRDTIRAAVYLSAASGRMVSLRAIGKRELLGPSDRVVGNFDVDFQFLLEPTEPDDAIGPLAAEKVTGQPTSDQTALLYEHQALGIRFQHPRRLAVAKVEGSRVILGAPGLSVVINVEPEGQAPTVEAYKEDVLKRLKDEKIDVKGGGAVQKIGRGAPGGERARFTFDAVRSGKPTVLDYWVIHEGKRGVTMAGSVSAIESALRLAEMATIARSMSFPPPGGPKPPEKP